MICFAGSATNEYRIAIVVELNFQGKKTR